MSIFEHGKEELIAEIARRQDQIIRSNKSNVRVLGEVASQRLRDQIANNVCKEVLPANTEEYTGTLRVMLSDRPMSGILLCLR
jgi:phosphate uptake regulator